MWYSSSNLFCSMRISFSLCLKIDYERILMLPLKKREILLIFYDFLVFFCYIINLHQITDQKEIKIEKQENTFEFQTMFGVEQLKNC